MREHPTSAGQMLLALDLFLGPTQEVVLAGDDTAGVAIVAADLRSRYWPNKVVALADTAAAGGPLAALVAGKKPIDGQPTVYVCQNFTCQAPAHGQANIAALFDSLAPRSPSGGQ